MKDHWLTLEPLPGRDSFLSGRYGIETATLEGVLRLNSLKLGSRPCNDALLAGIHKSTSATTPSLPIVQRIVVSFTGTLTSGLQNNTEVKFLEVENVLLDTKQQIKSNEWSWKIQISRDKYALPPSRVISTINPLKKSRKILKIKYALNAICELPVYSGGSKIRCSIPIDPFIVWPSFKSPSMRNVLVQLLRPVGHRWSNILPTAQYDLSVSSTTLGPGDSFDWSFRIVPRGHSCSNLFFKLVERYEFLEKSEMENPMTTSNNLVCEKVLISWDYRSDIKGIKKIEPTDLFNQDVRRLSISASSPPNPTTLISELKFAEDGSLAGVCGVACDNGAVVRYGCVRHEIRIKIAFSDAPSIRLRCPVIIFPLSVAQIRDYNLNQKQKSGSRLLPYVKEYTKNEKDKIYKEKHKDCESLSASSRVTGVSSTDEQNPNSSRNLNASAADSRCAQGSSDSNVETFKLSSSAGVGIMGSEKEGAEHSTCSNETRQSPIDVSKIPNENLFTAQSLANISSAVTLIQKEQTKLSIRMHDIEATLASVVKFCNSLDAQDKSVVPKTLSSDTQDKNIVPTKTSNFGDIQDLYNATVKISAAIEQQQLLLAAMVEKKDPECEPEEELVVERNAMPSKKEKYQSPEPLKPKSRPRVRRTISGDVLYPKLLNTSSIIKNALNSLSSLSSGQNI